MIKISWVTTARSEYNASRYVIKAIADDPEFKLMLYVCGTQTLSDIEKAGYAYTGIGEYMATNPHEACIALSNITEMTSRRLHVHKPDLMIINGDRIELMPIVLAATLHGIPLAHIGGGDLTDGSMDNLTRYAISRYAHLHLVSDEQATRNLIQSGEEESRVFVVGQCGLENVARTPKLSLEETSKAIGLNLSIPTALCIYYPSIEPGISVQEQIFTILEALNAVQQQTVFIYPCEELESNTVQSMVNDYCRYHPNCKAFANLENQVFQSLMKYSAFMIGNSSAGIIEAPFLKKWTINVGSRQKGRHSSNTVFNFDYDYREIMGSIYFCRDHEVSMNKQKIDFPSKKIVQVIKDNIDRPDLLYKKILLGG